MKNEDPKQRKRWRIIAFSAIAITILAFSPVVLKPAKIDPKFLSMPFTLWLSILITIILVILTYIAGRVYLKDKE